MGVSLSLPLNPSASLSPSPPLIPASLISEPQPSLIPSTRLDQFVLVVVHGQAQSGHLPGVGLGVQQVVWRLVQDATPQVIWHWARGADVQERPTIPQIRRRGVGLLLLACLGVIRLVGPGGAHIAATHQCARVLDVAERWPRVIATRASIAARAFIAATRVFCRGASRAVT